MPPTAGAGPPSSWRHFPGPPPGMPPDAMGDRVTVPDHATTAGGTDTIHTYSGYATPGIRNTLTSASSTPGSAPGPHLLGAVTTTGAVGGTDTYAFDGAGNTTTRQIAAKPGAAAATQILTWDAEGRLSNVTDAANHTTADYLYDAAGTQLIRRDTETATGQTTSTLYPGTTEIHSS